MALIQCPHCGKNVSDKAQTCPHCGKDPKIDGNNIPKDVEEGGVSAITGSNITSQNTIPPETTNINQENKKIIPIWGIWLIIVGLLLTAGGVAYWFYYNNVYLPNKRDAEAPRYYVIAQSLNMRSTAEFEADYNKIGSFPYGTEILVYDSVKSGIHQYFYGKYAPKDAKGKLIKEKVLEGYISYNYMFNKGDFFLTNSIFGNDDARKMLSDTRYKRALLYYFKQHHYRGNIDLERMKECGISNEYVNAERWQVFCRYEKAHSNNVYRSKKYRKDSKYSDAAIIIQNLDSGERRLLYYVFDDDESFRLLVEQPAPYSGYMKDRTLKLIQHDYDSYSVEVEYEDAQ